MAAAHGYNTLNMTVQNVSVHDVPANCSMSAGQWSAVVTVPLLVSCIVMLANMFNLVIFHYWRNKEPYILLHVTLALTSFLTGLSGAVVPIGRMITWTATTLLVARIATYVFLVTQTCTTVTIFFISLDRWLSVEFPVAYRRRISRRKVFIAVIVIWMVALLLCVPQSVIWRDAIIVRCNGPSWVKIPAEWTAFLVFSVLQGPLIVVLLFVCQLRIFVIVLVQKLRFRRNRRVVNNSDVGNINVIPTNSKLRDARIVARIVRDDLLASMVTVLGTVIINVPYFMLVQFQSISVPPSVRTAINQLFSVQHIYSPLVYVVFFPQYRAAMGRLVCGRYYNRRQLQGRLGASRGVTKSHGSEQRSAAAAPSSRNT